MRFPLFLSGLFSRSADVGALQSAAFIRFGLVWVIYIGLAWSGVPIEWIAGYEWFLFVANLFSFALVNGGKKAILNSVSVDGNSGGLIRNAFAVFNGAGVILALLFLLTSGFFLQLPEDFEDFNYTLPLALYIFLLVSSSTLDFFLLVQKKYKWIVGQSLFFNGALVAVVIIPIFWGADLSSVFWLMNAVLGLQWTVTVFLVIGTKRTPSSFVMKEFLYSALLPLSLFALLGGMTQFVDGYLVAFLNESAADFALYRYGARELPLSAFLAGGISAALIPAVRADKQGGLERMGSELAVLYKQLFPLTIGLMLVSPFLFPLVFTEDFAASAGFFNIYLLLISSRLLLPQVFLIAARKNKVLLLAGGVEVTANVVLSLIFFQFWGIYGIAWATIFAYLASKLIMSWYAVYSLGIPASGLMIPNKYFGYLGLLLLAYLLSTTYTTWL
jgi:O-antigen/teichoic acid export membrane protein